ncbi:MAG: tetratricopeptide repeat protein, partial [Polyangiaceae bacterium]
PGGASTGPRSPGGASTGPRSPGGASNAGGSHRPAPGGSEDSVLAARGDSQARIRQALARAERHRRARQYRPAVAVLEEALLELPGARDLHERLCDVLIEGGDQAGAVERMLLFARVLADEGDYDGAARILDEVLLLEPDQPEALELLHSLGYAVSGEGYEAAQDVAVDSGVPPYQSVASASPEEQAAISTSHVHQVAGEPQQQGYDDEEPLPAYDLDDSAPMPQSAHGGAFAELDDPFGNDAPLPSFPIEDDEAARYAAAPQVSYDSTAPPAHQATYRSPPPRVADAPISAPLPLGFRAPEREEYAPADEYDGASADEYARGAPADEYARGAPADEYARGAPLADDHARGTPLDEDALEEVEFFTAQEMFDEARALLDEQLARLPGHPLLLERRRELEILAAGGQPRPQESGAHEVSVHRDGSGPSAHMSASMHGQDARGQETDDGDRAFDIAASLDALDALDALEAAEPIGGDDPGPSEQVSVEAVFEQFKAGVAAHVSESDAATHYDLGAAYRDMGLHSDAIEEFRLAARDPTRECVCWSMIGMLQLEHGKVDLAIDAFLRGLHANDRTLEQENKLNYEIGNAYEMRGSPDQALYYFQRVLRVDATYDDPRGSIEERVSRVSPRQAPAAASRAVGAEPMVSDEFDAAFDELLSRGGKLP